MEKKDPRSGSPPRRATGSAFHATKPAYKNEILRRLSPDVLDRLELRPVDLPANREIEFPGNSIDHLFFLESGIASMTCTFENGLQVEFGIAGMESILGVSAMVGTRRSLNRVYMQVAGCGYSSQTAIAVREFRRGEQFHDLSLCYLQAQFLQTAQTAGCNARHTIEQRFARWLLLCSDRMADRTLPLSHEFIADMLGVTRSSVTLAAGEFQRRKLIQYTRGKLRLIDLPGLEALSCECYRVVRDHLTNYADTDPGPAV